MPVQQYKEGDVVICIEEEPDYISLGDFAIVQTVYSREPRSGTTAFDFLKYHSINKGKYSSAQNLGIFHSRKFGKFIPETNNKQACSSCEKTYCGGCVHEEIRRCLGIG